ncbi:MAG: hypothetical protein IKN17_13135 [Ruminococcus sp.]|nr:hypothetical protein [Ruminococcus sp.]
MARFRKLAALTACAVIAATVSGCTNTQYSVKYDDKEVKPGVYIGYAFNELNNQIYNLYYTQGVTEDYFSQQVEGVSLSEYVKNNSLKDIKEYAAISKQFEEAGLTISDDELKTMSSNVNSSWDSMGGMYEYIGVSKESLKEIYRESLMRTKLFDSYYAEGGKEPATDEELQKYVNDNYIRYKMISIYKSSATDDETKEAENKTKLETRDKFYEQGKDYSFDDFDKLIDDYNASSSTASDDTSSAADDTSSAADDTSSAADDASSAADDASSEAASAADESEADSSEAAIDTESEVNSADDSSADDSAAADDSSTGDTEEPQEEEDPYKNEVMINLASYEDEDFETASGQLYKFIRDAEVGKVLTFENDNAYYIVVKGDVSQRTDYVGDNRDNLIQSVKNDDFQSKLDSWIEAMDIQVNDKAVKRYTPEVLYDRMMEYNKKNSTAT